MLPTTSSAISAAAASVADGEAARLKAPVDSAETAEKFEGLLWSGVLAPLSQAIGPFGDVFTNAIGAGIARDQHDAFYQHLRALVELSDADAGAGGNDRAQ